MLKREKLIKYFTDKLMV